LLLLFVALGAKSARADTLFTYMFTEQTVPPFVVETDSWTTQAIPAVTSDTTLSAAALTASSTTGALAGCSITSVELDMGNFGNQATTFSSGGTCGGGGSFTFISSDQFALADYSTAGTYIATLGGGFITDTLVVTAIHTPEPTVSGLALLGVGLVLVMRKRIA
jgi:hypothetical protein